MKEFMKNSRNLSKKLKDDVILSNYDVIRSILPQKTQGKPQKTQWPAKHFYAMCRKITEKKSLF